MVLVGVIVIDAPGVPLMDAVGVAPLNDELGVGVFDLLMVIVGEAVNPVNGDLVGVGDINNDLLGVGVDPVITMRDLLGVTVLDAIILTVFDGDGVGVAYTLFDCAGIGDFVGVGFIDFDGVGVGDF